MTDAIRRVEQFMAAHENCGGLVWIKVRAGVFSEAWCGECKKRADDEPERLVPADQAASEAIRGWDACLKLLGTQHDVLKQYLDNPGLSEPARVRLREQLEYTYKAHRRLLLTVLREATDLLGPDVLLTGVGATDKDDPEKWMKHRESDFKPESGAEEDPNDAAP